MNLTQNKNSYEDKRTKNYGLDEIYRYYKSKDEAKKDITREKFRDICETFNELIVEYIIKSGKEFHMGSHMGRLYILPIKINPNNPPIDYNETKKLGKTVYHNNLTNQGKVFKFAWGKGRIPYSKAWTFKPVRANKKYLSKCAQEKTVKT